MYSNKQFYVTEKLDGCSATYGYFHNKPTILTPRFNVCSRRIQLFRPDDSVWWQIAKSESIEEKLKHVGKNIAIQGEIIGPGDQGNKYKLKELDLRVFNVWDIDKQRYFDFNDKRFFCGYYGFLMVPYLYQFVMTEEHDVKTLLFWADGKSWINSQVDREGLVFRDIDNDGVSFKAISNKFLEKHGE
jgi:RNA ligase (TIGR02306 family)